MSVAILLRRLRKGSNDGIVYAAVVALFVVAPERGCARNVRVNKEGKGMVRTRSVKLEGLSQAT
jgi:hypothetical protein